MPWAAAAGAGAAASGSTTPGILHHEIFADRAGLQIDRGRSDLQQVLPENDLTAVVTAGDRQPFLG